MQDLIVSLFAYNCSLKHGSKWWGRPELNRWHTGHYSSKLYIILSSVKRVEPLEPLAVIMW